MPALTLRQGSLTQCGPAANSVTAESSLCWDPDSRIHSDQAFSRRSFPGGPRHWGGTSPQCSFGGDVFGGGYSGLASREVSTLLLMLSSISTWFLPVMPAFPCQVLPTSWCVISPTGHSVGLALPRSCPGIWTPFSAPTWYLPLPR